MRTHERCIVFCIGILSALLTVSAQADSIPLDLNDFFADPTVTVSTDGTHALFEESTSFAETILSNDPFLGDLEVIFAGPDTFLEFEYTFTESALGNDEFGAWVIDPNTGGSFGSSFEFFMDETGSGTVSIDLSGLHGTTGLGFHFQLSALSGDGDFGSTLEIHDLRLVTPDPIPEPTTLSLLGIGLTALVARRRYNETD